MEGEIGRLNEVIDDNTIGLVVYYATNSWCSVRVSIEDVEFAPQHIDEYGVVKLA